MADLPKASLGAVVCDPPYDLTSVSRGGSPRVDGTGPFGRHKLDSKPTKGFMGKAWDGTGIAFTSDLWTEVFRVLVPGGVIKVFGGTRTFHRLAAAMEAVGFEDVALVALGYGSGFPKSLDVGKALDKMHGAKRGTRQVAYTGNAVLRAGGQNTRPWMEAALKTGFHELADNTPVTSDAQAWNGWGTALKPAWEPVLVGRKPEGSPDSRSG
jgi:site-specific DNA-methyltransferase (adenine-specific)